MKLSVYNEHLRIHDYYYAMSDDRKEYNAGKKTAAFIETASKISDNHKALYQAWSIYHFSGPHFAREQAPLPKLAFWRHLESDGVFVTTDVDEYEIYAGDVEVSEITEEVYLELEKQNGN